MPDSAQRDPARGDDAGGGVNGSASWEEWSRAYPKLIGFRDIAHVPGEVSRREYSME